MPDSVYTLQTGYAGLYIITPDSITHRTIRGTEESKGLLVRNYYKSVVTALKITEFMSEDNVYESVADFWHEEDELEKAPHLDTVLAALEEQLNIITCGVYKTAADDDHSHDRSKYADELRHIAWEINSLKAGRYYEADNPRFGHQRGIPRISTVGKKLCDRIMELVWKMDNNAPNRLEEIAEAVRNARSPFDDVFPDIPSDGTIDSEKFISKNQKG